ncbi:hypothetical protein IFM89_038443 [Coptis chinensis]|uniref:O-fucosyltransferase family protein n=1 Tax=Coptis chinensis TaxID=261450 RepID=A0A835I3Y7_9MAGN|nr:hypothetical protein IFM89_038443 [Coptis chinensis]
MHARKLYQCISKEKCNSPSLHFQVDVALNYPYHTNLERLENRRSVEHYNVDNLQILKTSYRYSCGTCEKVVYATSKRIVYIYDMDFNLCQTIQGIELKQLERWVEENRLDKLNFARQKQAYCYFSAAATFFSPELSESCMSWAKNGVLTTVFDNFFDIAESDLKSLSVTVAYIDEDCNENAYTSFALGPITIPALYFVGPLLSEEAVRSGECDDLLRLTSICARYLNGIQGFKRENSAGKPNGVSLLMIHDPTVSTEEEAIQKLMDTIDGSRRELMKALLETDGSILPRACKDLFRMMCRVVHLFYMSNDGFSSIEQMVSDVKAVMYSSAMSLSHPNNPLLLQKSKRWSTPSFSAISSDPVVKRDTSEIGLRHSKGTKERISEMFKKVELSVSSYDTAWVAMVPSPSSPISPCFPECVNWLLENQLPDGSWGLPHHHPFLMKDTLSSTLASVLALKRWNIGEEHVSKGLHFIRSNFSSANDEKQRNPIGFDIIFPGMIEYAQEMGINLHLGPTAFNALLHERDVEINRCSRSNSEGGRLYLAYVAEGLGKSQNWKDILKHQRKNGSLFNSPSTTAAALAKLQDINCLNYLRSLLEKSGNTVPAAYPQDIYTELCMVDSLERLGIDRHFKNEIRNVLDRTYSCWLMKDEEIFYEISTCSMAFRILRMHGYDVSSDELIQFNEEEGFLNTLEGYQKDTCAVLELYRASHIALPDELFLEKLKTWSHQYLKQELSYGSMHAHRLRESISKEVDVALNYPYYSNLERLENRRTVEHYSIDNFQILKTSYRPISVDNKDFLELAVEDFNLCQSIQRKELKQLERWVEENRLDKLNFARQKQAYCYFSAAATLFHPELSDARMSWAKGGVLTTVVDDFYDVGGSKEELANLIDLLEKWDEVSAADFCSEQVEIVYNALRSTIVELGEKAFRWQQRDVTRHIVEIWLTLIKSMMKESEWTENKSVPTMDEYNNNAYTSFALGPIVLPALYFVGPRLSEEAVRSEECHNLFRLMSTCGRNLNDIQGFKRENNEGKLNGVSLLMIHDPTTNGSIVPRPCKDLFWKMCRVVHLFYMSNDGFTSGEQMMLDKQLWGAVNFGFHPCVKPTSRYKEAQESNRYITVRCNGGLNQMRTGISDMVAVARIMNATLVVPQLDKKSFWKDSSTFSDIFDEQHFITTLQGDVKIVKELPKGLASAPRARKHFTSWSDQNYYKEMEQLWKDYQVIHVAKSDSRLANNDLPLDIQRLRCRALYHALRFSPPIESLGKKLLERLRSREGKYIALHLRYEKDMLSFTGCTYGLTDTEAEELRIMRENTNHWKMKTINSTEQRNGGFCPLTPKEVGIFLQALGYPPSTLIYIAAGEIYGGETRLSQLRFYFPNLVFKESIATVNELKEFANHASQTAALDYIVSVESEVFVPSYSGNMARAVEGHRRFLGHRKTITPDRKRLVEIFDTLERDELQESSLSSLIKQMHGKRQGGPRKRGGPLPGIKGRGRFRTEESFYENPFPECICRSKRHADIP